MDIYPLSSHVSLPFIALIYAQPWHSGYATLSADEHILITSNLNNGIDTYSMPPNQHIRSLLHPIHCNVPLIVCSVLGGSLTLAGSDDGCPQVFDQCLGLLSQSLPHTGKIVNFCWGCLIHGLQMVTSHRWFQYISICFSLKACDSENDDRHTQLGAVAYL